MLVPPGGRSTVEVEAESIDFGSRQVLVSVETDSAVRPVVALELEILGRRKPPYVAELRSDLYYRAGYTPDEVREVIVTTTEPDAPPANPPIVLSEHLSFLRVDGPELDNEVPYQDGRDLVGRVYRYRIAFASPPPDVRWSGAATVADPWHPDRVLSANIIADANPAIHVTPSHLIMKAGGADGSAPSVRFFARSVRTVAPLTARMERGDESPLRVDRVGDPDDDGFCVFELSTRDDRSAAVGTYNVLLRAEDDPSDPGRVVPVRVP